MNAAQLADRLDVIAKDIARANINGFGNQVAQVAAELRALGGGWLPIESAPKDGTRVILDWDGKSINGFYLDNTWARIPYAGWRVEAMVVTPKGQPTHWQPLPPSPAATVEGSCHPGALK